MKGLTLFGCQPTALRSIKFDVLNTRFSPDTGAMRHLSKASPDKRKHLGPGAFSGAHTNDKVSRCLTKLGSDSWC